jgi:hypothetical protein
MKYPKIGDKVQVMVNEIVPDINEPFHHYELGEIVRVVRVSNHLIYCINPKGLEQALKPTHIKPIKNQ